MDKSLQQEILRLVWLGVGGACVGVRMRVRTRTYKKEGQVIIWHHSITLHDLFNVGAFESPRL